VPLEAEDTEAPDEEEELSVMERMARERGRTEEKKIKIAELSQDIIASPDTCVGNLKHLLDLSKREEPIAVRKLSLVSLAEVFKDLIPSYRIRDLTAEERAIKVKKDVRILREFEEALMNNYKRYLQILEEVVQGCLKLKKKQRHERSSIPRPVYQLGFVAVRCLCSLLQTVSHFNFRNNIIHVLVPKMELDGDMVEIGEYIADAIGATMRQDRSGEVSLEILKQVNTLAKLKHVHLHPRVGIRKPPPRAYQSRSRQVS